MLNQSCRSGCDTIAFTIFNLVGVVILKWAWLRKGFVHMHAYVEPSLLQNPFYGPVFIASDSTLTINSVAEVMELVNNWKSLTEPVIIPSYRFRAIERKFSIKREVAHECASYYVHCHPLASWTYLANQLYLREQFAAVMKLKSFLPLRGKYFCCRGNCQLIRFHRIALEVLPCDV